MTRIFAFIRKIVFAILLIRLAAYAQMPKGWDTSDARSVGLDLTVTRTGKTSLHLAGTDAQKQTYISQDFKADRFQGKRVRFSAYVRAKDVERRAMLMLTVDDGSDGDWMNNRPIQGTVDWKKYELVVQVPTNSIGIEIGARIVGKGELWLDSLNFEVVDMSVPVTTPSPDEFRERLKLKLSRQPDQPENLSFAGPLLRSRTFIYKTVGNLPISADVFRYEGDAVQPVVVMIHGGALITGGREVPEWPRNDLVRRIVDLGFVVVSIDYRLAPETKLPAIIEDLEDAFNWVRSQGPILFHGNPERIAAWGGSAGGYLALSSGHRVKPPPRAIVSLFGYGDLIGDWYSKPSTNHGKNRPKVTEAEARAAVRGAPVSNDRQRQASGGTFYVYCRQQGSWPHEVSDWNPFTEAEKFFPYMPLKNVSTKYPPTLMMHGTADTDVPYEQSRLMAAELQRHNVEHRLITIDGGEHGFGGGDPKAIDAAYSAALEFLQKHLKN